MPFQRDATGRLRYVPGPGDEGSAASVASPDQEGRKRLLEFLSKAQADTPVPTEEYGGGWAPTAIRGAAGFIPGGPWGAVAGGGAELLAQLIEGRDDLNWTQVGAQTALGAVPFGGKAKSLLQALTKGGVLGATGAGITESAETGELPHLRTLATGAAVGGGAGAGVSALSKFFRARPTGDGYTPGVRPAMDAPRGTFDPVGGGGGPIPPAPGQPPGVPASGRVPYRPDATLPQSADRLTQVAGFEPSNAPTIPTRPEPSLARLLGVNAAEAADDLTPPATTAMPPAAMAPDAPAAAPSPLARLFKPRVPASVAAQAIDRGEGILDSPATQAGMRDVERGHASFGLDDTATAAERQQATALHRDLDVMDNDYSRLTAGGGDDLPPLPDGLDALNRELGDLNAPAPPTPAPSPSAPSPLAAMLGAAVDDSADKATLPPAQRFASKIAEDVIGKGVVPKVAPTPDGVYQSLLSKLGGLAKDEGGGTLGSRAGGAPLPEGGGLPAPRDAADAITPDALSPRFRREFGPDERGFGRPDLSFNMLAGFLGAGAGAYLDPEDRLRGAALGGVTGAAAPHLIGNPTLERLRFASMLSSPLTHAKNVLGVGGSTVAGGLEQSFAEGSTEPIARTLRELFSPDTIEAGRRAFADPSTTSKVSGPGIATSGPLSVPGRLLGAEDAAGRSVLTRAGFSPEDAERRMFAGEPHTETGKAILGFQRTNPLTRFLMPFVRTATNITEQGLERMDPRPLLNATDPAARRSAMGKLALSGLAAAAGASLGDEAPLASPWMAAAAGPYALPYLLGNAYGLATEEGKSEPEIATALANAFAQQVPLAEHSTLNPSRALASYVPNALRDVNTALFDDTPRDTRGTTFGPAIAKIPGLSQTLPAKTSGRRKKRRL